MQKKGFTLIELLAVIVLLGIIIAIAAGVYIKVNDTALNNQLKNKIKTIEIAAEKWAEETNIKASTVITVDKLIKDGYLQADKIKGEEIIYTNPVNNESLLCYTIEITKSANEYQADFKLEDGENCDLVYNEEIDDNIQIKAYSYQSGKIVSEIKNVNNILEWVNTDVLLVVNSSEYQFTEILYTPQGGTITKKKVNNNLLETINLNQNIDPNKYANTYVVNASIFLQETYTIGLNTEDGVKNSDIEIRIDKEIAMLQATVDSHWTKEPTKKANITGSDGRGSGLKGFYISTNEKSYQESDFYASTSNLKPDLEQGTYYLWTIDNVGNVSKEYQKKLIVNNIDTIPPVIYEDTLDVRLNEDFSYKISIEADDKESGILGYYLGNGQCDNVNYSVNLDNNYDIDKTHGDYKLCVKDQVGNISEMNIGAHLTFDINFNKIQLVSFEKEVKFEGNLIFVLDVSGSMSGSGIRSLKTVATEIIEGLEFNNNLTVSIISFESSADTLINQSKNKNQILNTIDNLDAGGGTNFSAAIEQTASVIRSIKNDKGNYVLFLSDGYSSSTPSSSTLNYVKNKASVYAIGAGSGVDKSELLNIASSADQYYSSSTAADSLREVFTDIITSITEEYSKLTEESITDGSKKIETLRIDSKYPVTISANGRVIATYTSPNNIVYSKNGEFYFDLYKMMATLNLKVNDLNTIVVKYYYEEK